MMKRIVVLFLSIIMCAAVLSGCDTRDRVWGTYSTEKAEDGNYKSVEFAYSKVFYTADALAAQAEDEDAESDALIEGWYELTDEEVVCSFSLTHDEGQTEEHVYTFAIDGDVLTLSGYTVDGEDMPFEREEYKK